MAEEKRTYRVFLSAAEASGDNHCAGLIRAMKKTGIDIEFVGVGGPKMAEAGCNLLETTTGQAAMIYNAFKHVFSYIMRIKRIADYFKRTRIDLVVVCDSPAFNFHVAKAAKKADIKTMFYVAPQLWAWASWRIKKMRKWCDKLCCILPFEEEWFRSRGVDATFVGNPLLDELGGDIIDNKKDYTSFNPKVMKLALMPGSRPAEIKTLWRPMQEIAIRLKKKCPNMEITTVAVDDKAKEVLKSQPILGFKCKFEIGTVIDTAKESDFAIVASGSATLQVAAAGCPMIVIYQSSKLLWHLVGKWLIRTPYLCLVNIIAQRAVVAEFMPYFDSIEPMIEIIQFYLADNDRLTYSSRELVDLVKDFANMNAAENTAKIAVEMLQQPAETAPPIAPAQTQ